MLVDDAAFFDGQDVQVAGLPVVRDVVHGGGALTLQSEDHEAALVLVLATDLRNLLDERVPVLQRGILVHAGVEKPHELALFADVPFPVVGPDHDLPLVLTFQERQPPVHEFLITSLMIRLPLTLPLTHSFHSSPSLVLY